MADMVLKDHSLPKAQSRHHTAEVDLNLHLMLLEYLHLSINLEHLYLALAQAELATATPKINARLDLLEKKDYQDMMVSMDFLVFLVKKVLMLKMPQLKLNSTLVASTALLDLKDHPDLLDELVLVVCVELVDNPEFLDVMETPDSLDLSDLRDHVVLLEKKESPVRMVKMLNIQLDFLVLKERLEYLDPKVMKVHEERPDQLGPKDLLVTKDLMERMDQMETMVNPVREVRKESQVLMPNIVLVLVVVVKVVSTGVPLLVAKDIDVIKKSHQLF